MEDGRRLRAQRRRVRRFVHAKVTRPYSHSLSDDERLYKTAEERAREAARDPIKRSAEHLLDAGPGHARAARRDPRRGRSRDQRSHRHGARAPRSPRRDTAGAVRLLARRRRHRRSAWRVAARSADGKPDTMVAAINRTLHDEMRAQPAHRGVRRGRGRRQPRAGAGGGHRQGRRVQGDARPAARVRQPARVQLAAGRGQHRRARHRAWRRAG